MAEKEKLVTINIPLGRTKQEKADVFVGVNGRKWLIKRGCDVQVPPSVAEVLRHKEEMMRIIYESEE